ncbi:MAG TPA: hypothetical protein VJX92_04725 [Methylomirabilota bacterium]|nr:hypothetical protein [Methylomirabilota bacterium]
MSRKGLLTIGISLLLGTGIGTTLPSIASAASNAGHHGTQVLLARWGGANGEQGEVESPRWGTQGTEQGEVEAPRGSDQTTDQGGIQAPRWGEAGSEQGEVESPRA